MSRPLMLSLSTAAWLAVAATPAFADAERLEADLRALFSDKGTLAIGSVDEALIRDRVTAEELVFDSAEGERLLIERYVVSGDYDSPDEVTVEGVRLEDGLTELALLEIESLVFGEPSSAVLPLGDHDALDAVTLGSLAIDGIALDLASRTAEEWFAGTPLRNSEGRMTIEKLRGEALSRDAIGWLEITGVDGVGQNLDELGDGSFSLASLRLEGLTGLDEEGAEELESLSLNELAVDSDRLVGSLAALVMTTDLAEHRGEMELDDFRLDLARMIELAPEDERTQFRMVSNVLTDGSGELMMDAAFNSAWHEETNIQGPGAQGVLSSDGSITLHEALALALVAELPMRLPEGMEPAALFGDEMLSDVTLLGGELGLTLANEGLFGRMITLGAATEGVSEAAYLEQVRTQANGFGMMFGPRVQSLLLGLVALAEGEASELEINVTLPANSRFESLTEDPLALPERLDLRVETR
ncbi:hypothetical protein [Halomonas urumqiensis]|uniref:DUF945 domain-containing protein n=1 Tax=Halomonas urumqiensis TaxID=1684789 RepID=A0A2N7UCT2_9GAMM|nr:hypothetical protein [Halomonas urumqiensis]PMR78264.1 hypothetical protein C1H70_15980 [Halomonas urumqiensis]PTB03412.1 hypothetical protein C6V82_02615 [Halomonas urumqiensis]GHE20415.1 hypothetical protein GCM10017767_09360 [Halomonas urumqiensis]